MQTKYKIFKIKDGKGLQWMDWCREIERREEEARRTLRQENLSSEHCIIFDDYVIYTHVSKEGGKFPMNMNEDINLKHKIMMEECLHFIGSGYLGYNIFA
jgi:hypothetical protein